jgi:protein O-mannosyl-transferase
MNTRRWIATGSLLTLCLASTVTNLGNRFTQDDMPVIERNPVVHSLSQPWTFFTQSYWPKPFAPALYRPLSTLSYALEWVVGGGHSWVFRVASILMYAAAGLAFYRLALLLLPPLAAWLAAAFFMIHPVHVEAVAVAVNQSEIVVGLLASLTVVLFLRIRRGTGRFRPQDGAALFGLALGATLFKESGLMLIGLIVAAEITVVHDDEPLRPRLARIRPLLLVMLLGATTFFAIRTLALKGDAVGSFTAEALMGQTIGGRALTMLGVVPQWFRLLLWPAHLQGDYSPREIETATAWGIPQTQGALLLALTVLLTVTCWKRRPVVTFGLLWTAIGIFPVSNVLVPTGIVLAERTLFLGSMGMMLVIGGFAEPVIERLRTMGRPVRLTAVSAAGAILLMGTTRSASRQLVWKDQITYWRQTVIDAPLSYRSHLAFAQLLFKVGAKGWAEREYKAAMYLYPNQWGAALDLADKLRLADKCDAAVGYYQQALLLDLSHEGARTSLIACLLHLGHYAQARDEAREGMSYASRPARLKLFQRLFVISDSARIAQADPGTVRIQVAPSDTIP